MSERRRLLEIIASQGKWLPYSFEYLCHSLIPQKVNKNAELPQEYQEVEYIESSGTQYIDMGIKGFGLYTDYEIEFELTQLKNFGSIFGGRVSSSLRRIDLLYGTELYYIGYNSGATSSSPTQANIREIFRKIGNKLYRGNNEYTLEQADFNTDVNMYLFACNTNGSLVNYGDVKLYKAKFYYNNTLVRNFIPCYRKSDNVIGLYDSVNGVFYTNAGTGTFAKGNDVYRLVKNKAKAVKIYGNSEVVNQLVDISSASQSQVKNGLTLVDNRDGTYTLSGTASADTTLSIGKTFQVVQGHYYLIKGCASGGSNSTYRMLEGYSYRWNDIGNGYITNANSSGNAGIIIDVKNGTAITTSIIFVPNFIDLTQMFPFDTPTSLTDNRVQNIINRGFIPFNSGEIKNVDFSELMSEPYNLFDEVLEQGGYYNANGLPLAQNSRIRTKNPIAVLGNNSYTIEVNNFTDFNQTLIYEYDLYDNFLGYQQTYLTPPFTITTKQNTDHIRFCLYNSNHDIDVPNNPQICFHRTGTRTGYAPHTAPQTIPFKYQGGGVGTSHDTMTIYNDRVEFVKDRALVDLSKLSDWVYDSGNTRFLSQTLSPQAKTVAYEEKPNFLHNKYLGVSISDFDNNHVDKSIRGHTSSGNVIFLRDTSLNGDTSLISGTLEYQLATPQVITIPRKHLGVIDLGTLTGWNYDGTNHRVYVQLTNLKLGTLRRIAMYCIKYLTIQNGESLSQVGNMSIYGAGDTAVIYIHDTDLENLTTAQIQAKLSGILLFYETENEVADITDMINIEAGGTITSNWFSWVENQLYEPNTTTRTQFALDITYNSTSHTTHIEGTADSEAYCNLNAIAIQTIAGHKYLLCGCPSGGSGSTYFLYLNGNQANIDYGNGSILEVSTAGQRYITLVVKTNVSVNFDVMPRLVDLTTGFPDGDIPTSINDPRIQEILRLGYIPTNTTGTLKHIDPIVLPNADMKLKSK